MGCQAASRHSLQTDFHINQSFVKGKPICTFGCIPSIRHTFCNSLRKSERACPLFFTEGMPLKLLNSIHVSDSFGCRFDSPPGLIFPGLMRQPLRNQPVNAYFSIVSSFASFFLPTMSLMMMPTMRAVAMEDISTEPKFSTRPPIPVTRMALTT